jgi:hypothetical protein
MKKKRISYPIRIPVTQGLVDSLGKELHFGILGLQHGDNSADNWKKVGKVIFIISIASDDGKGISQKDKTAVDNAVITLEQISNREVDTGVWSATEIEILALCRGALAAESILPHMDSRVLAKGYDVFLVLAGRI